MALDNIQLNKVLTQIIMDSLRKGVYPKAESVSYKLASWLKTHVPGLPLFKFRPLPRRALSSSRDYNEAFNDINDDLDTLFTAVRSGFNSIAHNFTFLLSLRRYLTGKVQVVEDLLMRRSQGDNVFYDTFNDFSKVDLRSTTALVDLNSGAVVLDNAESDSVRVNLLNCNAVFEVTTPYTTHQALRPLINAFDDNANTAWLEAVEAGPDGAGGSLVVDLGFETSINKVSINLFGQGQVQLKLEISVDGQTWQQIGTTWAAFTYTWDFSLAQARYIRLSFYKNTPDVSNTYYFGAQNIAVYKKGYLEKGELISRPFKISDGIVNTIELTTEAEVPGMTSIDYYVALSMPITTHEAQYFEGPTLEVIQAENADIYGYYDLAPGGKVVWLNNGFIEARFNSPATTIYIQFNASDHNDGDADVYIDDVFYGTFPTRQWGNNYIRISNLMEKAHTVRLKTRGNGDLHVDFFAATPETGELIWEKIDKQLELGNIKTRECQFTACEPYQSPAGLQLYRLQPAIPGLITNPQLMRGLSRCTRSRAYFEAPADYIPTIEDWRALKSTTDYISPGSLFATPRLPNAFDSSKLDNFYCFRFYVDCVQPVNKHVFFNSFKGITYSLYINSQLVSTVNGEFYATLKQGLNEIVVLVYNSTNSSQGLTWNWNLSYEKFQAEAGPMELVDYFALAYATPPGNNNRYAIVGTNEKYIVLNYRAEPSDLKLVYSVPQTPIEYLRFKAVLAREPGSGGITPKLNSYTLKIS
ncbi:hypothetical protein MTAT_04570 [Moorella thermoacetica]|uniref:F5/8 type C domain protein n=1 Tax=Neomoorella thermoacetica TaxID=1525 RepID=A0AAC9HJ02_NEOTH|nr:discoidin domain-containing protein [Moorella thermoacetica]AOQ24744.1 F5/8 type C domain protein [Moorella thermoacetica]TYL15718.1 hypothetical protein MTAT_04570 [Moorella thermoacetica]